MGSGRDQAQSELRGCGKAGEQLSLSGAVPPRQDQHSEAR